MQSTLLVTNISHQKSLWRWFSFSQVGYVSSLEGTPPTETHKNSKHLEPLKMAETSHQLQCWACFVRSQVGKSGTCQVQTPFTEGQGHVSTERGKRIFFWGGWMANQEAKLTVDSLFWKIWTLRTLLIKSHRFGQQKEVKKANDRNLVGSCSPSFFFEDNEFYLCDVLFQWFSSRSDMFDAVAWTRDLV